MCRLYLFGLTFLALALPSTEARAAPCKTDADCVLLPELCPGCDPCGGGWRRAGTLAEKKRLEKMGRAVECPAPRCPPCPHGAARFGTGAICRAGQCLPEHAIVAPFAGAGVTACGQDSDCVPLPRSGCGCPRCGLQIDSVVGKDYAERLAREHAREKCQPPLCSECKTELKLFPARAICHQRRCTLSPVR